jgi:pantoate--beta-alanine ligase
VRAAISSEPLARLDYAEAVDDDTLEPVTEIRGPVLLAVAAYFGKARLIDNVVLEKVLTEGRSTRLRCP